MTREPEIRSRIAKLLDTTVDDVEWQAPLDTLALASLQFVEVVVDLQEEFGAQLFHQDMDRIDCLDDLVTTLDGRIQHGPGFGRIPDVASEYTAERRTPDW
jgi:acyl carrier protein